MGIGNNAFFLAARGYAVTGVDISSVAVTRVTEHAKKNGLTIQALEADLAEFPIEDETYDLIVNFYFLDRNPYPQA